IFGQRVCGGGAVVRIFVVIHDPDQSRYEFGHVKAGQAANELGAIFLRGPVRFREQGNELLRDFFSLLFGAGFSVQESDQAFHSCLVNSAMTVADEIDDGRKQSVRISSEYSISK